MWLWVRRGLLFSAAFWFAACGGGGGSGDGTGGQPPTASPGAAQSVMVGEAATLDGTASSDAQGLALGYAWRLASRPNGSRAVLDGASTARPTFVPDVIGDYTLMLTVDNGHLRSAEVTVVVSATPDIRAPAKAAQLAARVDFARQVVDLSWVDGMPAGTVFHVETVDASGAGTTLDTVDGAGGTGGTIRSTQPLSASQTLRIRAFYAGSRLALQTASGSDSLPIVVPPVAPSIAVDKPEPLIDAITLSIANAGNYPRVDWYVDLAALGSSASAPAYAYPWDASRVTDGAHLLLARTEVAAGVMLELRRTVTVSNSTIDLTSGISTFERGRLWLIARATSDFGVRSAEAFVVGHSLGVLTAYNLTTPRAICCAPDAFGWRVDNFGLVSGEYDYRITVTDNSGAIRNADGSFRINNPPVLVLDSPPAGARVHGSLTVSGSFSYDKPLTVTVVATLGALEILRTTSSPFATSFSLDGVVPGNYTLKVRAADANGTETLVERTVTVTH